MGRGGGQTCLQILGVYSLQKKFKTSLKLLTFSYFVFRCLLHDLYFSVIVFPHEKS